MSTRIFNVWLTSRTLNVIHRSLRRLKKKEEEGFRVRMRSLLGYVPNKGFAIDQAFDVAESILTGCMLFSPVCSATIYPYPFPGPVDGPQLMLVHLHGVTHMRHASFVRSISGKDFHYQNSTDKPDSVTHAEWKRRKKVWDVTLPGPAIPADNGFSYDIVSKQDALAILFAELRLLIPPLHQDMEDGKPWVEWGPPVHGLYKAADVERAWRKGKEAFAECQYDLMNEWLKPLDDEAQSFLSASL